jgi:hypothetical protein
MRVHRWSSKEGTRGVRSFANVHTAAENEVLSGRVEAYWFSGARHTGISLSTDDDTAGIQFFIGLAHVGCFWLTLGSPTASRAAYKRWKKSLPDIHIADLRLHDRAVWWALWHDKHSWSSGTPKWRHGSFHWWDWLVGKPVYRSEFIDSWDARIPMPEGVYKADITMSKDTWTRPRWPWPQVRHGYNADIKSRPGPDGPYDSDNGYIPVPGKGENSWDCGGDGIFGQSGSARTVEEAIGNIVSSALATRRRHGGRNAHNYAEPIS